MVYYAPVSMALAAPALAGLGVALAAPSAVVSMQEAVTKSGASQRQVSDLLRRLRVTALDRVLRKMMLRCEEKYSIFMGTLDAMSDNLIREAVAAGIQSSDIAHAMFSCQESATWLDTQIQSLVPLGNLNAVRNILHLGVPLAHTRFATEILDQMRGRQREGVEWDPVSREEHSIDLSDFERVDVFHFCDGGMRATRYAEGCVLLQGSKVISALEPHREGIYYYLHKSSEGGHTSGTHLHLAAEMVQELLQLNCDPVIAWRLAASVKSLKAGPASDESKVSKYVDCFRCVSGFRTALEYVVSTSHHPRKRLFGSKEELRKIHQSIDAHDLTDQFSLDNDLFKKALRLEVSTLMYFTPGLFDSDPITTYMSILEKLIKKAKESDVNKGKKDSKCTFNARTVAILGSFSGREVWGSVISSKVKAQYFYQDDDHTKSLSTPFSKMMMFSTTQYIDAMADKQEQYLQNYRSNLEDWIALRAAFEFDIDSGKFRYGTASFLRAEELLNDSLVDFVGDVKSRFATFFSEAPATAYVSRIAIFAEAMSTKTGASSAWILRELIARFIHYGAAVENAGRDDHSAYGRFESLVTAANRAPETKTLFFDCKVSVAGITCQVNGDGTVWLLGPITGVYDAELFCGKEQRLRAGSQKLAFDWLAQGKYDVLEARGKTKTADNDVLGALGRLSMSRNMPRSVCQQAPNLSF